MKEIKYIDARPLMKPGDVIAFGGRGFISESIKFMTNSAVSHVGIILKTNVPELDGEIINQVIESTSIRDGFAGVQINRMRMHVLTYNGEIWWLPLSDVARHNLNLTEYLSFLMRQVAKPYDAKQAIGSAIDILPDQQEDFDKLFCSELACASLEKGGVLGPINASEQTPADVCRLPIWDEPYQLKGKPKELF